MRGSLGLVVCAYVAVSVLCTSVEALDDRETEASTNVATIETKIPAVFDVPRAEELAVITHSGLRAELLRMAHEDQVVRTAGT